MKQYKINEQLINANSLKDAISYYKSNVKDGRFDKEVKKVFDYFVDRDRFEDLEWALEGGFSEWIEFIDNSGFDKAPYDTNGFFKEIAAYVKKVMNDSVHQNNSLKDNQLVRDASEFVYSFSAEDVTNDWIRAMREYGLKPIGKYRLGREVNYAVRGTLANLNRFAHEYLDYIYHPDYLTKEEDFDYEDLGLRR